MIMLDLIATWLCEWLINCEHPAVLLWVRNALPYPRPGYVWTERQGSGVADNDAVVPKLVAVFPGPF